MEDTKYKKIIDIADKLISQVRTEALVSLRFLDVALYKHKIRYDFNTTIYTDGVSIVINPYYMFRLYKEDYNKLLRAYLHIVMHCIFFHLFIDKKVDHKLWNLSTDISVENIINELKIPTLIPDVENNEIKEIIILKNNIKDLTAEKIYNYFINSGINQFEIERLSKIFVIDDHRHWYKEDEIVNEKDEKSGNDKNQEDYKEQKKNELNEEELKKDEHDDKENEQDKNINNNDDLKDIFKSNDDMDEMEEKGSEASDVDGDKNKSDTGDDENEEADSTNKSDINENSKNEEERLGGENVDRDVRTKNIDKNLDGDVFSSIRDRVNDKISDGKDKKEVDDGSNLDDTVSAKDDKLKKSKKDDKMNSSYNDWKKISERTKEDLLMFENSKGDRTFTLREYIEYVNEEKYNYEEFLNKFAVMSENIELNDEEFDNVYYTFGLNMYKNIPLVEPLEYKEAEKIKDFVVAIDVSGSVKGDLVEKFLKKTYTILASRNNYFNKVNIHIVLCDTEIKNVYKLDSLDDLKNIMNDITLSGFGGTDFRPVFNYVDSLKEKGELKSLKGLIYFTDGLGEYPKKIPEYDTAFVFIKEQFDKDKNKIFVPPWAIKLVLEDV